jgi:hypothetical protein
MRIIRSVAAIAGGLGFMAATVTVGTLLASAILGNPTSADGKHSEAVSTAYIVVSLLICGIGALLGGWLAARIASCAPYAHASVMAAIVALLSVTTATGAPAAGQPDWYPSALGLVAVFGILLGGKLRAAAAAGGGTVVA